MNARVVIAHVGVVAMFVCGAQMAGLQAQGATATATPARQGSARRASSAASSNSLGTVRIPEKVTANGQPLAAGTYTLRLSDEAVTPVSGESPDSEKWVEFVQRGQVKGRELATVIPSTEIKQVAEMTPPRPGTAKVQALKGSEYLRVWINHGGTHYLVHLTTAK